MSDQKTSSDENLLCCSFCGKNQKEVIKLIAGPKVYICNECVSLCSELIDSENSEPVTISTAEAAALRQAYEADH